jgi:hypothetical protein
VKLEERRTGNQTVKIRVTATMYILNRNISQKFNFLEAARAF